MSTDVGAKCLDSSMLCRHSDPSIRPLMRSKNERYGTVKRKVLVDEPAEGHSVPCRVSLQESFPTRIIELHLTTCLPRLAVSLVG